MKGMEIMLKERSKAQKVKYYIFLLICEAWNYNDDDGNDR
jgi:hypothetical protein